uniref:Uncharacterized protein LOC111111343 isoform X4 n=1 Tax=Crassostrea virginica TaxID=6565 RepID=A0A8B8BMA7_CRAVI|nr:uncharacterized protein LOC111111343 isoform X4 [Crassostrea virginica]
MAITNLLDNSGEFFSVIIVLVNDNFHCFQLGADAVTHMASKPKRKRTTRDVSTERPATISADISQEPVQPSPTTDVQEMVTACMAAIVPTIAKTCRDILSQKNAVSSTATSSTDAAMASNSTSVRNNSAEESTIELLPAQSLLQDITGFRIQSEVSPYEQRTDTSSSFVSKDLSQTADLLIRSSLSTSTTAAYKSVFQSYKEFIELFFPTDCPLPPSLQHLTVFIAHCYLKGSAASTVRTAVSALSFVFQLGGFTDITQHFIVKKNVTRVSES